MTLARERFVKSAAMCAALLLSSSPLWAQVAKPTPEEAELSAVDVPGGAAFKSKGLSPEPGLVDPRDFTGTWDSEQNIDGFFLMRNRKAPGGDSASTATPAPPDGPPGNSPLGGIDPSLLAAMRAQQTSKLACMPTVGPTSGGDGPVEIIQTADQLTWMAEEMHAIRRIFLQGAFTANFESNYNGESIGHFEGNTLVVETRGMKSLAPGVRMMERINKSEQGRILEDQIGYVDEHGNPTGNTRTLKLFYRPNEKMLEWICEDNGQIYQPGVYGREL